MRTFDGILLASVPSFVDDIWLILRCNHRALVATSFKSSAQVNAVVWFFVSCSMIQAVMSLICSTILIIFFSGHRKVCIYNSMSKRKLRCRSKNYHHHIDAARLHFISWNIWDLLSIPAIWTTWYGDWIRT